MISVDTTPLRRAIVAIGKSTAGMSSEIDELVKDIIHDGVEHIRPVTPRSDNPFASAGKEHIQDNWEALDLGIGEGAIANALPEVEYLFEDTAPHEIEAFDAMALHFGVGGDEVFARSVEHPGTIANQTMIDTIYREQDHASDALAAYGDNFIAELAHFVDGLV